MAHVTLSAERKVMIIATLANPVTGTLVRRALNRNILGNNIFI